MAGWYERGGFYPNWCRSAVEKLRFYTQEFPIAEVDSTYYAIPSQRVTRRWVRDTPDGFVFNVKAFRLFTAHYTEPQALPPHIRRELPMDLATRQYVYYSDVPPSLHDSLWENFTRMLEPIGVAAKLGVVLFQFAPWFSPFRGSFDHILECKRRLPDYRIGVEFRNHRWLHPDYFEQTLGFLRDNDLEYVSVDEPQGFGSSVPPLAEVTGSLGVIRFHGRNDATWEEKGLESSVQRFDYYYSPDEMGEWVPRIRSMEEHADEVHVIMNTNNRDQGSYNGRLLFGLLGEG